MICKTLLIKKVLYMCLVGLIVNFVLLYYVCVLGMSGIVLIGKQNGQQDITKT